MAQFSLLYLIISCFSIPLSNHSGASLQKAETLYALKYLLNVLHGNLFSRTVNTKNAFKQINAQQAVFCFLFK